MIADSHRRFLTALPERERYQPADLLVPELLLASDPGGRLAVYYAPFGWINREARLAIIGVTPGFTQMELALRVARRQLLRGSDEVQACREAKLAASFAGTMRLNLTRMLDDLGLPGFLGCRSEDLFAEASHLLHSTSAVCFPVFVDGRNYTGSAPRLTQSPLLMKFVRERLAPELSILRGAAFLPLGKAVEDALRLIETEGLIPRGRALYGFPHPSGANGHRAGQFARERSCLAKALRSVLGPCESGGTPSEVRPR